VQLVNHTPLPARLDMARFEGVDFRVGLLTAKATFRFDASSGAAELDTREPFDVLVADQQTELGVLPRDLSPRRDHRFEVMLLGHAHAPAGTTARSVDLRLGVGHELRAMTVFGDRRWQGEGSSATPGAAEAFERMPLTWERAFGGRARVEIDDGAFIELREQNNPDGRGFDIATQATRHGEALRAPQGYPRWNDPALLPNLEDPNVLIASRADAPLPVCWAPLPAESALRVRWQLECAAAADPGAIDPLRAPFSAQEAVQRGFVHAHPQWIIERPAAGAEVLLEGLSPNGARRFPLPQLAVFVDSAIAGRRGSVGLAPQALVLLPDEERFYLVYRGGFRTDYQANAERSLRLRIEEGWQPC
jgi:hypothetical protein